MRRERRHAARAAPVASVKMVVTRADGTQEDPIYVGERLPRHHLRRRLKLRRHLRFMRREEAAP